VSASLAADLLDAFQQPRSQSEETATVRERTEPVPIGPSVSLADRGPGPRADLLTTLQNRRSTRFFGDVEIPASTLVDTVIDGIDADSALWGDNHAPWTFEVNVVAIRVTGLEQAIYRLDPAERTLTRIAALPPGEARYDLTLQREFCDAGAIISLAADLNHIAESLGPHGYRMAMTRAGATAYTIWLQAIARGLAGTVFAGFIPAAVRQPLHSDGASRHQLFALALGVPAAQPAP
jgi:hypothetical protein